MQLQSTWNVMTLNKFKENNMYTCPVCLQQLAFTPYYNTEHGKVCEDCFESRKGEDSEYDEFKEEART